MINIVGGVQLAGKKKKHDILRKWKKATESSIALPTVTIWSISFVSISLLFSFGS